MHDILYYVYVLFYGAYVSMRIACGRFTAREWRFFAVICPLLLLLQGLYLHLGGMESVWLQYPVIVHLPIVLALIGNRGVKWDVAAVSVVISYAMCQLPRWLGLAIGTLPLEEPAQLFIHLAASQLLLLLLDRFCLDAVHDVLISSGQMPMLFGAMPAAYYLYEYFSLYTRNRYTDVLLVNELMPTGVVLFFVLFVIAFKRETDRSRQAERQTAALESELSYAQQEIGVLRASEEKTAIYRHDFRHHLMMLDGLLAAGKPEQAAAYIRRAEGEIDALVPIRYCDHETVNLLLSAFRDRAKRRNVMMRITVSLPGELRLPDTELCTMLSNGLENALNAAAALPEQAERSIEFFGGIKQNHLLIEIKNPYAGEIAMQDGIPLAKGTERRYGCRSIQAIVQRHKGVCIFDATGGVFVLRIAIPM